MIYEPLFELEKNGINIKYHTNQGEYTPAHWHGAIELMYILNGVGTILIEGKEYKMIAGEFIVVDSNQIHEARCARASMMIVIHFSRSAMIQIEPNLEKYRISCRRSELLKTNLEDYFQICDLLKKLPPLHVNQPLGYRLERQAIALQIMAKLLSAFSYPKTAVTLREDDTRLERLSEITNYIEEHHTERLSLEQVSGQFYLSREYFSRFFKENMGVTFSKYLNQIRLMHIYHDLCSTKENILDITEKHGFTNYKLFNKMFQETYGCKPRELRARRK